MCVILRHVCLLYFSRGNAIFFSTRGARAAADEISGSDYDGDNFTVIADQVMALLFTISS